MVASRHLTHDRNYWKLFFAFAYCYAIKKNFLWKSLSFSSFFLWTLRFSLFYSSDSWSYYQQRLLPSHRLQPHFSLWGPSIFSFGLLVVAFLVLRSVWPILLDDDLVFSGIALAASAVAPSPSSWSGLSSSPAWRLHCVPCPTAAIHVDLNSLISATTLLRFVQQPSFTSLELVGQLWALLYKAIGSRSKSCNELPLFEPSCVYLSSRSLIDTCSLVRHFRGIEIFAASSWHFLDICLHLNRSRCLLVSLGASCFLTPSDCFTTFSPIRIWPLISF